MGDQYITEILCPKCGLRETEVYFAPTHTKWRCACGHKIDVCNCATVTYEIGDKYSESIKK